LWAIARTSTTYALTLKDFVDFVESQSPISNTPNEGPKLAPTRVVGFDWSW